MSALPKTWRWMPGMRCRNPCEGSEWWRIDDGSSHTGHMIPDLDDRATQGCIEHGLLPEAWPGKTIKVERFTHGHRVSVRSSNDESAIWTTGYVEGHAIGKSLLACLEAAPT